MKRIYLSPSSQEENRYAVGQTNEAEQCRKIALALAQELERMGFAVKTDVTPGKTMYDRVAQSNAWVPMPTSPSTPTPSTARFPVSGALATTPPGRAISLPGPL